jgi:hypothetical protein
VGLIIQVSRAEPATTGETGDGTISERLNVSEGRSSVDSRDALLALEEGLSSADILAASAYLIAAIAESANADEVGFGAYCASILEELSAGDSTGAVLTLRLDSIPVR